MSLHKSITTWSKNKQFYRLTSALKWLRKNMWLSFGSIDYFFSLSVPQPGANVSEVFAVSEAFNDARLRQLQTELRKSNFKHLVLSMRCGYYSAMLLSSQIWAEVICWIVHQLLKRAVYRGLVFITECSRNAAKFQLLPSCIQHVLQDLWAKWKSWGVNPENMPYKVPKSNQKCDSKPSNAFLNPFNPFNLFFS